MDYFVSAWVLCTNHAINLIDSVQCHGIHQTITTLLSILSTLQLSNYKIVITPKTIFYKVVNKASTGKQPACTWFLEITFCAAVNMLVSCVCIRLRGHK